jgi:multidrug resistance protein
MSDRFQPSAPGAGDQQESISRARVAMILAGTMLGVLFASLGQTIIGPALPRVVADLGGLQHYAWVFSGYMLASTVSVPIYGKLSDIYGRRPFFLLGMSLFLFGSALSGLSQDMTQLVLFRAVQGLGAGATMPIVQAIIGDIFPPSERGKWQGLIMAAGGVAAIVGPISGGWITDNLGWRWVFYVNMPVGVLAILTVGLALPGRSDYRQRQIDYSGAALLVAAAVPLLLAFSWAGSEYP